MPFLDSKYLWRVWRSLVRASITREMEFRSNFLLGLFRQFLWLGVFILTIETIFYNTTSLSGWDKSSLLIILALSRLVEGGINTLFARNIAEIPQTIRTGSFDFYLTKPLPVQFYAAFHRFALYHLGNTIMGLILLIYAAATVTPHPTGLAWLLFILLALLGITIFYSLLILVVSLAFYMERMEGIWAFMNIFSEPLTVPFDIFPTTARYALTYLLPLAFVTFVPAQALTGRLHWQQIPVAIGITVLFLVLANLAWHAGLRRYSSASS